MIRQKQAAALSSAMALLSRKGPIAAETPAVVVKDMHRRNIKLLQAYMMDMPIGSEQRERAEKTIACLEAQIGRNKLKRELEVKMASNRERTVVSMTPGWIERAFEEVALARGIKD